MATFTTTVSSDIAAFLTDYVLPNAIGVLRGEMSNFADIPIIPRDLQTIERKTKKVIIPKVKALQSYTLPENTKVTDQVLDTDQFEMTYAKRESTFVLSSITNMISNPAMINSYVESAVTAIMEYLCTSTLQTAHDDAGYTIGSAAAALTYAVFIRPRRILTDNKMPKLGRYFYIDPSADQAIMNFTEYQNLFGYEGSKAIESTNGRSLAGFTMRESIYLPAVPSAGVGNVAFSNAAVVQCFVDEGAPPENIGIFKITQSVGNVTMSLSMQAIDGGDGAYRVTLSVLHAKGVSRPEGVVAVNSLDQVSVSDSSSSSSSSSVSSSS